MKILYFSPLPFHDLKQRPQEIAEALSKRHDVWYIEPTISYIGTLRNRALSCYTDSYDISPTLHILKLDGRFSLPLRMQFMDPLRINTIFERRQLSNLLKTCDMIWIGYEVWQRLLPLDVSKMLVYDKMDDNVKLSADRIIRKYLTNCEKQLLKKCNIIFVTARQFLDRMQAYSNVYLVPNGFQYLQPMHAQQVYRTSRKVFGYIGKISHWFDTEAVKRLAVANPDCDIILVGPCDISKCKMPNIKYAGTVPKEEVPDWICSFDVCLYPFKQTELLDTINPVKIYEYLAYNKPVLAVNSNEIQEFKKLIYIYDTYDEMVSMSHKKLNVPFKSEVEYKKFLEQNSWITRVEQIEQIINEVKES